ncbi:hypothetical protein GCM10025771_35510 [Niveibacterium umoris]|uniref:DUF2917 domain-containing protein n=1 Tax=Niveibacterium umoris TaxID=1193620 RepID=A0A840BEZ8_9RHOO|nr:DUF2917 domain-containing protein [Niveibacterium umoris]MBB4011253.1 hypothetical protein [Niveibacterium umoris]
MKVNLTQSQLNLDQGDVLALTDAAGLELRCTRGRIWLTTPDQAGDHILDTGVSFQVTGRGKLVIEATEASRLTLRRRDRASSILSPNPPTLQWAES